jgi:hypothetical protein
MALPTANFSTTGGETSAGSSGVSNDGTANTRYLPTATFNSSKTSDAGERNSFANASTLNGTGQRSKPSAISASGRNKGKPLIYGDNYFAVRIIDAWNTNGSLKLLCGIGYGELTQLTGWFINDEPPKAGASIQFLTLGGLGSTSPFLQSEYLAQGRTFTDTYTGDAVMCVTVPDDGTTYTNFPSISVRVKGRKIFDPRDSSQSVSNPGSWKYSNNSALVFSDFITSAYSRYTSERPRYGRAQKVVFSSVVEAANWCDELLGTTITEVRNQTDIVMMDPAQDRQWEETLRTIAELLISYENGQVKLIPDRPRSSVFSLTDNNVKKILYHNLLDVTEQPTSVEVQYINASPDPQVTTNGSGYPWPQASVRSINPVNFTTAPHRAQQVNINGIHRTSQALRHARKRRIALETSREELGVEVFDEQLVRQKGDVALVGLSIGIFAERFSLDRKRHLGNGRFELHLTNYRPGAQDDTVTREPPVYQTPASYNCNLPAAVYNPTITQLNRLENGVCVRRLVVEWDALNENCVDFTLVTFTVNGVLEPTLDIPGESVLSRVFLPGDVVSVSIAPYSSLSVPPQGSAITVSATILPTGC